MQDIERGIFPTFLNMDCKFQHRKTGIFLNFKHGLQVARVKFDKTLCGGRRKKFQKTNYDEKM